MARSFIVLAFLICPWLSWSQEPTAQSQEYKNAKEYFEAMDLALKSFQQGEITSLQFERVFFPKGEMQFFLSYNFENPEVASLLQRIQKARVSDTVANNIPSYISGQQKQRDIYIRNAHPEIAKPVPLLSGGYAPPDPAPSMTPDPMSAPLWLNSQKAAGKVPTVPLGPTTPNGPTALEETQTSPTPAVTAENATQLPMDKTLAALVVIAAVIGSVLFFFRRKPTNP